MKHVQAACLLAAALLLTAPAHAREAEMLITAPVAFAAPGADHLEQNRKRITAAAKSLGWVVDSDANNTMALSYDKAGKHKVQLRLEYDAESYRIHYVDSVNMNYVQRDGVPYIHPNYNRWVRNLIKQIGDFSLL